MSEKVNKAIQDGFNAASQERETLWETVDALTEALGLLRARPELKGRFSYTEEGSRLRLKMDGKKIGSVSVSRNYGVSLILYNSSQSLGKGEDAVASAIERVAKEVRRLAQYPKPGKLRALARRLLR